MKKELTLKEGTEDCTMIFLNGFRIGTIWKHKRKYEVIMDMTMGTLRANFKTKKQLDDFLDCLKEEDKNEN